MGKTKALLIGINRYRNMEDYDNLASSNTNVKIVKMGLERCLKLSPENIKVCKGLHRNEINKGELIKFLNENISDMNDDDTLILYFTGHGDKGKIVLSDGSMTYQELMDIIEQKQIKNKVLILDCCYAGSFDIDKIDIEPNSDMQYLIEHGYALMASCSENEESFLYDGKFNGQKCKVSPFSFYLTASLIALPYWQLNIYNGKLSLDDIDNRLRQMIESSKNKKEDFLFDYVEWNKMKSEHKISNLKFPSSNIVIATIDLSENCNTKYIYKTNIHGSVMFDVQSENPENIIRRDWKKVKNYFPNEVKKIQNEIKKTDDIAQMFIHAFREYCNQDIDEDELIHTLADINKKLRDLENNISFSKNEGSDDLQYYEVGMNNLKALASRFGYYYDPDCFGIIGNSEERKKETLIAIRFYNNELSRIEEIESLMYKN
ncbi:MAG: caspase family protein [Blautia hansenii]